MEKKGSFSKGLSQLNRKRQENKLNRLKQMEKEFQKTPEIKRSKSFNYLGTQRKLRELSESFYLEFKINYRFDKIDNNMRKLNVKADEIKESLKNLEDMKYTVNFLFLQNVLKDNSIKGIDKEKFEEMLIKRSYKLFSDLIENGKKNDSENIINIKNEINMSNKKSINNQEDKINKTNENKIEDEREKLRAQINEENSNKKINKKYSFTKRKSKNKSYINNSSQNSIHKDPNNPPSKSKANMINISGESNMNNYNTNVISKTQRIKDKFDINLKTNDSNGKKKYETGKHIFNRAKNKKKTTKTYSYKTSQAKYGTSINSGNNNPFNVSSYNESNFIKRNGKKKYKIDLILKL